MSNSFKNYFRSPIITVVGHIDHGKTTLIDYIGKINNAKEEHGGITQHVKAYNFNTSYGVMTFLDTPGHFAFNSLRENSIKYCDIVLLVISIDDGIKPQTIESINIAKKYSIPIIVVVNKIDKIDLSKVNKDKLMSDLSNYGLISESWGGDTIIVYVSAKTGDGVSNLLELIKIQSDILDLKLDYNKPFYGIILDNKIDVGLGPIATLILKNGVINIGDNLQIKDFYSKVKSIFSMTGEILTKAESSLPINVTGLSNSVDIGEVFFINNNIKDLKKNFLKKSKKLNFSQNSYDLDFLVKNLRKDSEVKFNIILKVDVQGSLNVLKDSISNLTLNKVKLNFVKCELGSFNESDVDLAVSTDALLIGFNIKISSKIKKYALKYSVNLNLFNVIYDLIDFIQEKIINIEKLKNDNNILGIAEVRKIFKSGNSNNIAGCFILSGKIRNNCNIKIFRKDILIHTGFVECLKIFKSTVTEVKTGEECGISLKSYDSFQIGDKINFY